MYNSNPPQLIDVYGRSVTAGQLKYTPIVIHFRPSALSPDGSFIQKPSEYYLKIHPPAVVHRGVQNIIPEPFVLEVPPDGFIRLQLASSAAELPNGHYIVDYHRKGARAPLLAQRWLIPEFDGMESSHDFVYTGANPYELPTNVWLVRSVGSNGNNVWSSNYNVLTWPGETPVPGEYVRVVFQPALTLADIVDSDDFGFESAKDLTRRRA
jgi:hypothetical protein